MLQKALRYWRLIKCPQTGLLLVTGLAGYMSCRCPVFNLTTVLSAAGSMLLAISGSTVLNMWYDRDIDALMSRTCWRPLPAKEISPNQVLGFGLTLSTLGVGWALTMDLLFGAIAFAGLFLNLVVYTIWLKRRTAWSILWGGLAGGMPILAGRTLGLGRIDGIGLLLMLAVLFWIPTHIMTFSIRYAQDYQLAGLPTFANAYGHTKTSRIIAVSSLLAGLAIGLSAIGIGIAIGYLRLLLILSFGLLALAISSLLRPSARINFGLFKYASFYMLGSMLLLAGAAG
jgi:protoheme IX farnesyltransferase